jgi:hypothetical protein
VSTAAGAPEAKNCSKMLNRRFNLTQVARTKGANADAMLAAPWRFVFDSFVLPKGGRGYCFERGARMQ